MSEADLIAAIVAAPNDDIPREVYADWLEEQGDPRGAFVRAQLRLGVGDALAPEYFDALSVATLLEHEHRATWLKRLPSVHSPRFERGLLAEAAMTASAFLKNGSELLERAPIERLRLQRVKGRGKKLAASSAWSRLRGLDISGVAIPDDDLVAMFGSEHLSQLTTLVYASLSRRCRDALLLGPAASSLRELTLREGLLGKLPAVSLPAVERLSTNGWDRVGMLAPLRLPALNALTVRTHELSKKDVGALRLPLEQLRSLAVHTSTTKGGTLTALAERDAFASARSLTFKSVAYDARELDRLLQSETLAQCRSLTLPTRDVESASLRHLSSLNQLGFHGNPGAFAHADPPPLTHLSLTGYLNVDDLRRVAALAPTLRSLSLGCDAPRDGWEAFFQTTFPRLAELRVRDEVGRSVRGVRLMDVTDALRAERWPRLLSLSLRGVSAKSAGFANLAKAIPGSSVRRLFYYDRVAAQDALRLVSTCSQLARMQVARTRIEGEPNAFAAEPRIHVEPGGGGRGEFG